MLLFLLLVWESLQQSLLLRLSLNTNLNWYGRGVAYWTSLINYNIWKKRNKKNPIVGLVPRGNKNDSLIFFPKMDRKKKGYRLLFMLLVNMHILVIHSACVWLEICQNVGGKVKVSGWCKCIWFLFINRIDYYWHIMGILHFFIR